MSLEFGPKKRNVPRLIQVTTIGITSYRALLAQCRYFREQGFEVGFVFSPSPEGEKLRGLGFPVREIYIDRNIKPLTDLRSIRQLSNYFRTVHPDIVHTHTSKAGAVGRVAAKLARVGAVVHTVHGFPFHQGMFWPQRMFLQGVEKWLSRFTDAMLSQSGEDVAAASRLGIRPARGELTHIGNGVDLTEFDPGRYHSHIREELKRLLGLKAEAPVVTVIGRVNREKGYHDLVEALQRLDNLPWQALFIGADEGYLSHVRRQIDGYGLQNRIQVLGLREDIADLLAVTDIYVLPSYREGLPRSLIEAQAMALPCVATDIRGCREVIRQDVTGLLVPPGDAGTLAGALRMLLEDAGLRRRMGLEGRRRVSEHYNEETVSRRVMAAYGEVLNNVQNTVHDQQF